MQVNEKQDFGQIVYNLLHIIAFARLLMLTIICQRLTGKLKKTGEIIYDLMSNFKDQEIKEEVKNLKF